MSAPKPRKVPPSCWTPHECQALISAYAARWSALSESHLKPADWASVASTVAHQFPLASPPKTAVQCRQKMETIRKRYRTEKQRASSACPGGSLSSSWDLFQLMFRLESECPSVFGFGSGRVVRIGVQFGGGFLVRNDESYRYLGSGDNFNRNLSDPDKEIGKGVKFGGRFRGKDGFRGEGEENSNFLAGFDRNLSDPDVEIGKGVGFGGAFRGKGGFCGGRGENSKFVAAFDRYVGEESGDVFGFPVKSLGDRTLGPVDFRAKSVNLKRDSSYGVGAISGFDPKLRGGLGSKEDDPIEVMASSIEFLGEVFVKMEREKMEMARGIVKRRMEMEMKQNQLIMESQKQALAACVNALLESKENKKKKKKKKKMMKVVPLSPDS